MSPQEEVPKSAVPSRLGITRQAFNRWRAAAKLPVKGFYKSYEMTLLEKVGDYLLEDRSLSRASQYIDELLGE